MRCTFHLASLILLLSLISPTVAEGQIRAGAAAKNIDPKQFPVWVNGGIAGYQADSVRESLFSRSLVLDDGKSAIAIAIVDNCILPHEVTDRAKEFVHQKIGIPPERILVAATHTHSAVAVAGTHGCPIQEDYAAALPEWIAEGIQEAYSRRAPAQIGFTSATADRFIYCRDWIMKPGTANSTLFSGRNVDWVSMNPGHDNENKRAPVGSIDRHIPIMSVRDMSGQHVALLASFGTHYAGAKALSSDYFGFVCNRLGRELRSDAPEKFVGLMANGTSGNANCIDFSKPREPFTFTDVGAYVSDLILEAMKDIEYRSDLTIDSRFASFDVEVRMPSDQEVSQAKNWIASHLQDRLPKTMDENYARETVLLSELPKTRVMNVQALRIGEMVIAANPCESYGETGLKIRQSSPFSYTMNIGLANGHCGYIPPPEMFQLGSYTTWRCRTSCLEEFAEPKMVAAIDKLIDELHESLPAPNAKPRAIDGKPISLQLNPKPPVAPEQSLNYLETDSGHTVELVASEPLVFDPIAMQIDHRQRFWIVEMGDYPNPAEHGESRVVIVSDSDGDGVLDKRQVFRDGLRFATGVQPWKNGAFVTVEGKLIYLADEDSDGTADFEQIWLEGFSIGNPQLRANHPTITPDGWLTIASGLRLGQVSTGKDYPFERQSVDATGGDVRFHLLTGQLEAVAGPSQYGLSFDMAGRRYGCSNRQPCFVVQVEKYQSSASPLSGFASAIRNIVPAEADSRVHPLVQAWTTSNLHAGQFTAACGVTVVEGTWLGKQNGLHVLTCEPTGSLVQARSLLRPTDGRGSWKLQDASSDREFLASRDPWFRPVDLVIGPWQDLYVVDMYRAVIEHPEWVPDELKHRPDERDGDGCGRIYRIRNQKDAPKCPPITGSLEEIVKHLAHSDRWVQQQAALRILEEVQTNPLPENISAALRAILVRGKGKVSRSSISIAAQLLYACEKLEPTDLLAMLKSGDGEIEILGARLISEIARVSTEERKKAFRGLELISSLLDCAQAGDAELRSLSNWAIAWLGKKSLTSELQEQVEREALAQLVSSPGDKLLWMAVSKLREQEQTAFLAAYLRAVQSDGSGDEVASHAIELEAIERLSRRSVGEGGLALLSQVESIWPAEFGRGSNRCDGVALAILAGQLSGGTKLATISKKLVEHVFRLGSESKNSLHRILAVRSLGQIASVDAEQKEKLYVACLASESEGLVLEGIRGLSRISSPILERWLVERIGSVSPSLRNELIAISLRQPKYCGALIEAMETKRISPRLLSPAQMEALKKIDATGLRERITAIISSLSSESRDKVIARYRASIDQAEIDASQESGRGLFAKHCSSCHRIDGVGYAIGPDISDSRVQSYDKLLTAVLDPNRTIDANYFRYLARTEDGEVIEGILKESNAQTVVLEQQNGTRRTIAREELEEFKSSGQSMMPEGFEALINPAEMGQLLWYIKNWRYQKDGIPAAAKVPSSR